MEEKLKTLIETCKNLNEVALTTCELLEELNKRIEQIENQIVWITKRIEDVEREAYSR